MALLPTGVLVDGVLKEKRDKDINPQMKGRVYRKAPDQHGRMWGAEIDKRTDQPCGPKRAYFKAPWIPDDHYAKWVVDEETTQPRVVVQYAEIKGDRRAAIKDWQSNLLQVGTQLDGQNFDPSRPSMQVMARIGPKPPAVEVVVAAERGDAFVLGFDDEMPRWAVPYFIRTEEDEAAFLDDPEPATGAAEDEDLDEDVAPTPRPRRVRSRTKRAA